MASPGFTRFVFPVGFLFAACLFVLHMTPAQAYGADAQDLLQQFNAAFTAALEADKKQDYAAALPEWEKAFEAIDFFEETEQIVPYKETVLFKLGETNRLLAKQTEDPATRKEHYEKGAAALAALLERAVLAVYERDEVLQQQGYLFSGKGLWLAAQGEPEAAAQAQVKALESFGAISDAATRDDTVARERSAHGKTLKMLGRYAEAHKELAYAVQHWAKVGNKEELAREMNALASVELSMGNIAKAADALEGMLAEHPEEAPVTLNQASATFNLGICLQLLGEYQRSRKLLERAYEMAVALNAPAASEGETQDQAVSPSPPQEGAPSAAEQAYYAASTRELIDSIANSQGILDYQLGFYNEALEFFDVAAASQDKQLQAKALLNAVAVHIAALQEEWDPVVFQVAEQKATESMGIADAIDDMRTHMAARQNLARLYHDRAIAPESADIPDEQRPESFAKAFEHYAAALQIAEKFKAQGAAAYEMSDIASNVGDALLALSNMSTAEPVNTANLCPQGPLLQCSQAHYALALDNAKRIQAMEQLWRAHYGIGRVQRAAGQTDDAIASLEEAVEIIEGMRNVLGSEEAGAFLRNRTDPYIELIDILLERWRQTPEEARNTPEAQGWAAKALGYLERSRLASIKALFEQALPEERKAQGRALAEIEYRLRRLYLDEANNSQEIAVLLAEKAEAEKAIAADDVLLHKPAFDLAAAQKNLLSGQAVLAYYYDAANVWVWKLDAAGLTLHSASRNVGAGRRARDFIGQFVNRLGHEINAGNAENVLHESWKKLFKDTKLDLVDITELIVIPYGQLAVLPFGALLVDKDSQHYLMQDFEIGYLYSITQLTAPRLEGKEALLAVGNPNLPSYFGVEVLPVPPAEEAGAARGQEKKSPVDEDEGPKLDLSGIPYDEAQFIYRKLNPEDFAPTVQEVEGTRAFSFSPLASAGEEVRTIDKEYEADGKGPVTTTTDTAVTESELLQQIKERPGRYLHLATHGKLLPTSPLDSFLVFSEDKAGAAGYQSGLLTVRQIRSDLFGKLAGARLCTLSCCETALRGKGLGLELASLAGAFQSAGAAVVVASLWEVPSKATADLMTSFYGHLFAGETVTAALRAAQLEIAGREEYAAPVNWAAFVAIGVDPVAYGETTSAASAENDVNNPPQ